MSVVNSFLMLRSSSLYEWNKFVYSPIDGRLCYFQCLVIMNETGMNFFCLYLCKNILVSLGHIPKSRTSLESAK